MSIPNNINREHILQALQYIDKEGVPSEREPTKYALVCNGKLYPPKYTISIANKYVNQEEFDPSIFSGGDEANTFLTNLDFTIIELTNFDNTVQTLKNIYDNRSGNDDLVMIINSKNEVVERYQQIFSKNHVPQLTEDELSEFLNFKNNKHWIGLQRQKGIIKKDMDALKSTLLKLLDESLPIRDRLDTIRPEDGMNLVPGMKEALSTAILLISYPEKYGVWNSKSEKALKQSGLFPKIKKKATFGEKYTAINDVLNTLSQSVGVDLWTLDALLFDYGQMKEISEIDFQSIVNETIIIAESIQNAKLEGKLLSRTPKASEARDRYHKLIKPQIENFKIRNNGHTPNVILGNILKNYAEKNNLLDDFEIQKFHFYGQKLNSYVWSSITKKDDPSRNNRISYHPQLYILISAEGIKFGFSYGNQINSEDPSVTVFKTDGKFSSIVKNILSNYPTLRVFQEYSPKTLPRVDLNIKDQLIKNGFEQWSNNIIAIESHEKGQVPDNLIKRIETIFDALNPIFQIATYAQDEQRVNEILDNYQIHPQKTDRVWNEVKDTINYNFPDKSISLKTLFFEKREETQIISQVLTALKSGKHIILIGPPGTGKSKLAKEICEYIVGPNNYLLSTASSDWSTYETIGGYRPVQEGSLVFYPGIFLRCFQGTDGKPNNKWLIIDEINRADIDKAFGALFSALTGDSVTIPFEIGDDFIEIIGKPTDSTPIKPHHFIIHPDWRIIATMNTFDKSSLYEMSYAFMRRFALISVNAPSLVDDNILMDYTNKWEIDISPAVSKNVLDIWRIVNKRRSIGPAIIHDIINYLSISQSDPDGYASSIVMYILPQFEGLVDEEQIGFIKDVIKLDCIENKDYIKQCASEFFNISLERF